MDIRRESWLSQQMGDLRRVSRFSPMASEQVAQLRRASYVSYQQAAADQMQQYHQQMAYQHAAAERVKRASLQAQNLMAYQQQETDQPGRQGGSNRKGGYPNQRRNTTFY